MIGYRNKYLYYVPRIKASKSKVFINSKLLYVTEVSRAELQYDKHTTFCLWVTVIHRCGFQ